MKSQKVNYVKKSFTFQFTFGIVTTKSGIIILELGMVNLELGKVNIRLGMATL